MYTWCMWNDISRGPLPLIDRLEPRRLLSGETGITLQTDRIVPNDSYIAGVVGLTDEELPSIDLYTTVRLFLDVDADPTNGNDITLNTFQHTPWYLPQIPEPFNAFGSNTVYFSEYVGGRAALGEYHFGAEITRADHRRVVYATDTVEIVARPEIVAFNVPSEPVVRGFALDLSATFAEPSSIVRVEYRLGPIDEPNRVHADLPDEAYPLLAASADAPGHFATAINTRNIQSGPRLVFARAFDVRGVASVRAVATVLITGGPSVENVVFDSAAVDRTHPATITLNASPGVTGSRITSVELWLDLDGDGAVTPGVDQRIINKRPGRGGATSLSFSVKDWRVGGDVAANPVVVRTTDAAGLSHLKSFFVIVPNLAPTVTGVSAPSVVRVDQRITLSARVGDRDGSVASTEFYLDTDNNGAIEDNVDRLLGVAHGRDARLVASTAGFRIGENVILARATDNDGGVSGVAAAAVRVDAPPTITRLAVPDRPIGPGARFTLTAVNAADADGAVRSVEFFVDTNRNGLLDAGDRSLGKAVRSGADWSLLTRLRGAGIGEYRIFARATDSAGQRGVVAATVRVG